MYFAASHLGRARLYERLGEADSALAHYAKFVEMWADADPHLQPLVAQAKGRMAELSAEARR